MLAERLQPKNASISFRKVGLLCACCCLLFLLSACKPSKPEPTDFTEYGWIEPVGITGEGIVLYAKLDTGADNCSLHADHLEIYEKKGKSHVRFTIRTRQGEQHKFDRQVARFAKIKRIQGETQVRPVVEMFLCLGGQYMKVDVNLVDRSNFAYPLLVGRSFLAGHAMVNPAKSFTSEPQCVLPEAIE